MSEAPQERIFEVIGKNEDFGHAKVVHRETEHEFYLRRKDVPASDWCALVPARIGVEKVTGTTVRLVTENGRVLEYRGIVSHAPAVDLEKIRQGSLIRRGVFLDSYSPKNDCLWVVDDETHEAYFLDTEGMSVDELKQMKGMLIDLKDKPMRLGLTFNQEASWVAGSGTRLSFQACLDNTAANVKIVAQPHDHPDDHEYLEGKLALIAEDGGIIEHPETGQRYMLPAANASADFWAAAKNLYGPDLEGRIEPDNLIPVRFKRDSERNGFDVTLLTALKVA